MTGIEHIRRYRLCESRSFYLLHCICSYYYIQLKSISHVFVLFQMEIVPQFEGYFYSAYADSGYNMKQKVE